MLSLRKPKVLCSADRFSLQCEEAATAAVVQDFRIELRDSDAGQASIFKFAGSYLVHE
jgi:hypothetical protein